MRISPKAKETAFLTTLTLAMVLSALAIAAGWGVFG